MLHIFGLDKDAGTYALPFFVENTDQLRNDPYYRCAAKHQADVPYRWGNCTKMYHKFFPPFLRYETHRTGDILRTETWLRGMENVHGGNGPIKSNSLQVNDTSNINFKDNNNEMRKMKRNGTKCYLMPHIS